MRRRLRSFGLLAIAPLLLLTLAAQSRSSQSIWDEIYKSAWAGIYTDDQAARGQAGYRARCASCHGIALEGSDEGPPLAGRDFAEDWNCANIADLFEKIQFTMTGSRSSQLSEQQVADILSYILKMNQFPAGGRMLPANVDDLRGLLFFARNPLQ